MVNVGPSRAALEHGSCQCLRLRSQPGAFVRDDWSCWTTELVCSGAGPSALVARAVGAFAGHMVISVPELRNAAVNGEHTGVGRSSVTNNDWLLPTFMWLADARDGRLLDH